MSAASSGLNATDMEDFVSDVARQIALAINVVAIVIVTAGVVQALFGLLHATITRTATIAVKRAMWIDFARWLIGGLTLQLAADVVGTAIAPTWDDLGKLAAIAAIRTVLSYSLDRDMDAVAKRQRADNVARADEPAVART
jgi:uncharacterized membrane protein